MALVPDERLAMAMDDYSDAQVEAGELCERLLPASDALGGWPLCGEPAVVRIGGVALCEQHRERLQDWLTR